MRKALGLVVLGALAAASVGLGLVGAADDDKPKYTIKEVMKDAQKGGLYKKVAEGKASKEEKEKLIEYYVALGKQKPPKGDDKSWKEKTEALLTAAKACAKDEKGAGEKLAKAADCMTCHSSHKGKAK